MMLLKFPAVTSAKSQYFSFKWSSQGPSLFNAAFKDLFNSVLNKYEYIKYNLYILNVISVYDVTTMATIS